MIPFSISQKNSARNSNMACSTTKYLEINIYDLVVKLFTKKDDELIEYSINDKLIVDEDGDILPYDSDNLKINFLGSELLLSTSSGLTLIWDGDQLSEISMCDAYNQNVCGLCGNSDGIIL